MAWRKDITMEKQGEGYGCIYLHQGGCKQSNISGVKILQIFFYKVIH